MSCGFSCRLPRFYRQRLQRHTDITYHHIQSWWEWCVGEEMNIFWRNLVFIAYGIDVYHDRCPAIVLPIIFGGDSQHTMQHAATNSHHLLVVGNPHKMLRELFKLMKQLYMKYPDVWEHRMSQGFGQVNLQSSFVLLHLPFSIKEPEASTLQIQKPF